MNRLDNLLIAHIAARWQDPQNEGFEQRVDATYDAYTAAGGNITHYYARRRALRQILERRIRKAIQEERVSGYYYLNGHMLYFEDGAQMCPVCKANHDNLHARCTACQDETSYRDVLVRSAHHASDR